MGSPVTPQPPPLQPMWVQAPQPPPPVPPMPVMQQQVPLYPSQFPIDQPMDQMPTPQQPPTSRQNFRHRRFGKGPVRSSSAHDIAHELLAAQADPSGAHLHWQNPHGVPLVRSNSSRSLHQEPPAQQGPFWMGPLQQQHQQPPPPSGFMVDPWSGQPVMMGQPMAMGQPAMRRSMHELGSIPAPTMPVPAFFAPPQPPPPPPPPQLRTSSPSATSQTSEWSRVSEAAAAARQPHKSAKGGSRKKRPKRFNKASSSSRPHSRSHSRNSQRDWNEDNYPRSEVSDKGNSAEEGDDVQNSTAAAVVSKAEPVWMCEHCTYANGADLAVCQMCAKTAAAPKGDKERKPKRGKRPSSSASAKSAVRRERTPAAAKGSRAPLKSPAAAAMSEEEDDTEQDVRRAYYAVRRSAGGKMMERGSSQKDKALNEPISSEIKQNNTKSVAANETSSESSSLIHPRKASSMFGGGGGGPAKGILKKTSSNPNLAALDRLNVVDIRKYLKDRDDRELRGGDGGGGGDDGAERERADSPATSVLSEMTTATEPASGQRMYRALSGQSLPDMEVYQARASQQKQPSNRRGSEAGRQNFRSKRFSRNLEKKEPSHFKAQVRASRTEYSDFNEVSIKIDPRVGASHELEEIPDDGDRGEETLPVHVGHGDQRRRHQSMEDLSLQESTGIELARLLREAGKSGYSPEDVQVAVAHCGDADPVDWLDANLEALLETVMTLATKVGRDSGETENTVGTLSREEAAAAVRRNRGELWPSVTECVEGRRTKFDQLSTKGNFDRVDIVTALTTHKGNVDLAFQELNGLQRQQFLHQVWNKQPEEEEARQPLEREQNVEMENFKKKVRRLLALSLVQSYEKGEMAAELIDRGYAETEAIAAVEDANDLHDAERRLRRDCEICSSPINPDNVIKMPGGCEHVCCEACAVNYFTATVRERPLVDATCPFCQEPSDLGANEAAAARYFEELTPFLERLLAPQFYQLFLKKRKEHEMMKDPNFQWCHKCHSGYIGNFKFKRLVCTECRAMSCSSCLLPWSEAHEDLSCEEFAKWVELNNVDTQELQLAVFLEENGVRCPNCKSRYALSRGGCMHFKCAQCSFQFCIGCERPFRNGVKCGKEPGCSKKGLHAHHPRHCLFYLRDKEPEELQMLLQGNVEFKTEREDVYATCPVQVMKEIEDDLVDAPCGEMTLHGHAGYCKTHYVEYLCGLIYRHGIDPVPALDLDELKQLFQRANSFEPNQRPGEPDVAYRLRLAETAMKEIPLDAA